MGLLSLGSEGGVSILEVVAMLLLLLLVPAKPLLRAQKGSPVC